MSLRTQYPATAPHLVTNNPGTQTIHVRLLGITSSTLALLGRHSCECLLVGKLVHSFQTRTGFSRTYYCPVKQLAKATSTVSNNWWCIKYTVARWARLSSRRDYQLPLQLTEMISSMAQQQQWMQQPTRAPISSLESALTNISCCSTRADQSTWKPLFDCNKHNQLNSKQMNKQLAR